ncbi:MAG: cysteine desulfurase [Candidatus Krumholzibacteria bacterium]|nr:cysteine desulfurase [Candidatus Krumholzibacteria bacterium]MDH4337585.1 cysteine desulfurase [Candidatus Krumholzibacteria bacterium]MDH5270387.1 cysteine desulfurase [Candidatus Krumholzibacteria bacterium]
MDAARVREDFPILHREIKGKPLVYLDNAATAQKPRQVIDAISGYYEKHNANVHRGVHALSVEATELYEGAREKARAFINAAETSEIVFVRGTTEAINLVASSFGGSNVKNGDEVLITAMEHHSNIVPWQMLCQRTGATLRVLPMNRDGDLLMEELPRMLNERTRIVAVTHVSNSLGTVNPVAEIIAMAHERGIPVLVDGAQAVPHFQVDVRALDADFYVFSGHKMVGPTGAGVLYARKSILEGMPPWQGGGDMIASVTFEKTTYNVLPHRFEAGTPDIAAVAGLGAAIDYLCATGMDAIARYEDGLVRQAVDALSSALGVTLIGTPGQRAGVVSFTLDKIHPHDVGMILDSEGVAIRAGHHCTQPVMDFYGVPATNRASFAFYNTRADIDRLIAGLDKVRALFA